MKRLRPAARVTVGVAFATAGLRWLNFVAGSKPTCYKNGMENEDRVSELPELKQFIKETDQSLFDFCNMVLYGMPSLDDVVVSVFREFGDLFRKRLGKHGNQWTRQECRVELFRLAWHRVRGLSANSPYSWTGGRDTRALKNFDDDLLSGWQSSHGRSAVPSTAVLPRLGRLDLEFRAPLVLRDVLGFGDEEIMRILELRWGVYRHRLHRGRLEFRDSLRGAASTLPLESSSEHPASL